MPTESVEPRYRLDAYAIMRHPDALAVVEHLVSRIQSRRWWRQALCNGCESFVASRDKPEQRPMRPGAVDPTASCSGCWYAALDQIGERPDDDVRQQRLAEGQLLAPVSRPSYRQIAYLGPEHIRPTPAGIQIILDLIEEIEIEQR